MAAVAAKYFSFVELCTTPETAAHQAPLSLGLSRQEYWSGVPLPSPEQQLVALFKDYIFLGGEE